MPLWIIFVKWPAPTGPTRPQPLVLARRQRFEDRSQPFDHRFVAADHHAVAFGQAPHAAAGAAIDVFDFSPGESCRTAQRICVIGIAAIDHDVAGGQQWQQIRQRDVGDFTGWHHQPQCARDRQFRHQRNQRICGFGTLVFEVVAGVWFRVEAHQPMSAAHQALGHVGAHASQADHAEFHAMSQTVAGGQCRLNPIRASGGCRPGALWHEPFAKSACPSLAADSIPRSRLRARR